MYRNVLVYGNVSKYSKWSDGLFMKKIFSVISIILVLFIASSAALAAEGDLLRLVSLVNKSKTFQGLEMTGQLRMFGFDFNAAIYQKGNDSITLASMGEITGYVYNDGTNSYFWHDETVMAQVIRNSEPNMTYGVDYNDASATVRFIGIETINGFECERYDIRISGGSAITLYVSTRYGVIIRSNGRQIDQNILSVEEFPIQDGAFELPDYVRFFEVKSFMF